MNRQRVGGIVLLVVGLVLIAFGLNASESVADRMSNFFTGHFTERTSWYLVGGGMLAVGGLALAVFGGPYAKA
jgi:hypothetical protein